MAESGSCRIRVSNYFAADEMHLQESESKQWDEDRKMADRPRCQCPSNRRAKAPMALWFCSPHEVSLDRISKLFKVKWPRFLPCAIAVVTSPLLSGTLIAH